MRGGCCGHKQEAQASNLNADLGVIYKAFGLGPRILSGFCIADGAPSNFLNGPQPHM